MSFGHPNPQKSLLGTPKYFGHLVLYDLNSGMYQNCPILVLSELFITCSNSRTYQNCTIPVRTRIVWIENSGTRFYSRIVSTVNYLPAAGGMTPLVKDFAANFHLNSLLPDALRQST